MLRPVITFLLFFSIQQADAQGKRFSLEDAMLKARTTLAPENLKQLQFVKGTSDIVYLKKTDGADMWMKCSMKTGMPGLPVLTLGQLNHTLRRSGMDTFSTMPAIQFSNEYLTTNLKGRSVKVSLERDTAFVHIDKDVLSMENMEEGPAGYVAYVDRHDLYLARGAERIRLTTDGSTDIVYASSVHQSEFGIRKGTFWSNSGRKLAYYRMDQHMVPDYPITDFSSRPAKVNPLKYPMAGDSSHHVTLQVYDVATGRTIRMQTTGPAEQYLTNVAWSPDDRYVFIVIVNREQNRAWVNQYSAADGSSVKTLFEESDPRYVEPQVPVLFVKNNPRQFVWQSRRDGWNHLYLYDTSGTPVRQLTSGAWEVTDVKGFDEKGQHLYYMSTAVSPLSRNLYRVNLTTGRSEALTQGEEVHNVTLSDRGDALLDVYSSPTNPRTIDLLDRNHKRMRLLTARNPLEGYDLGAMRIFSIRNAAGTELYCREYRPVSFESTKRYPVIVYWYGGPHAQMILNAWNGGPVDYWFQYMAQQGYLVFTLDTRGSANRGRDFEQSIFRHAGARQMEDLLAGVGYLGRLSYADTSRMGLFGWSYGGFMTTSMMLNHPGLFRAAVAGGPVIDWTYYEIMYTERYMDRPQENPEGYAATNLTRQIDRLRGKLLLIHGMQDNVVLMQHSVNLVKAAVDKGVQVDYMIYPGHEHNVLGKDRVHLYQKVTDYFQQHLK